MKDQRIAVFGMGRSGTTAAYAARRKGAQVTLFDQRPLDTNYQMEQFDQLQSAGIEVVTSWVGQFNGPEFDTLITSPGIPRNHPVFVSAQKFGIEIISEIEFAYRIAKAPILAITGTNGKSTTVVMAYLMAKSCIEEAYLCGNIAGSGYPELTLIEAAEQAPENGVLIAEVSSYQLEWIKDFRPKVGSITRIIADHFDRHPSFEDYQKTKLRLVDNMVKGDTYIGFQDTPGVPLELLKQHLSEKVELVLLTPSEKEDMVKLGDLNLHLSELKVYGRHNALNAQLAFEMVNSILGDRADQNKMIEALKSFAGLSNRLENVESYQGIQIVNNSMCTNPDAFEASAKSIPGQNHLLVGGNCKGLDYDQAIQSVQDSGVKIILFGDKLNDTLQQKYELQYKWFPHLENAFEEAMKNAKEGDTVMLCPGAASIPPDTNFRERGDRFKQIVKDWNAKQVQG